MFRETLEILRGHWIKGRAGDRHGNYCLLHAMEVAGTRQDSLISDVIKEQYPERVASTDPALFSIIRFNDHPDTTFTDIERVLEKAAIRKEENQ